MNLWHLDALNNRQTLTGLETLPVFRFFPASFWSRCASLSARSFSIPWSPYHWSYCWRALEADASLNARILRSWWECRWPFELMWVKRWDISENFCFFGQTMQRSGIEVSDATGAMFWVCVCPEAISAAGQSLEIKSRTGHARPGMRPKTNALN